MAKSKVYCVGVGPGDPELMTLKAARIIREHNIIAFPGKDAESLTVYSTFHYLKRPFVRI